MHFDTISKILIITGIILFFTGIIIKFFKFFPLGHLPGDIYIQKENFSFYFPITTSIIISILLSLLLLLFFKK